MFFCYNNVDRSQVDEIADRLRELGLRPWVDHEQLRPGQSPVEGLDTQLGKTPAAAVFVGKSGLGPWQRKEIEALLSQDVERNCRLIGVLLPDGPALSALPPLLKNKVWIDLRNADWIDRLYWGITGQRLDRVSARTHRSPVARDAATSHREEQAVVAEDSMQMFLSIAGRRTSWVPVDWGDGTRAYEPETLVAELVDPVPLPPDLQQNADRVKEENCTNIKFWNGSMYGLHSYAAGLDSSERVLKAQLSFYIHDYCSFVATTLSFPASTEESASLRKRYLDTAGSRDRVIPMLARGVGIALLAVTSDGFVLFGHRSERVRARPRELDVSVVEGLLPSRDSARTAAEARRLAKSRSTSLPGRPPVLARAAVLAAEEELGIPAQKRVRVELLGLGVDYDYYQWNLIGLARLKATAAEVIEARISGRGGRELNKMDAVPATAGAVFQYLDERCARGERMWSCGWATTYFAMRRLVGVAETQRGVLRFPPRDLPNM